jgi:hypothetical protein
MYWRDLIGQNLQNAARFAGKKAMYVVAATAPLFLLLLIIASLLDLTIFYMFFYSIYGVSLGVYFLYASYKVGLVLCVCSSV